MRKIGSLYILFLCTFLAFTSPACRAESQEKKVMAHRGASGQLPENSMSSFVLAAVTKSDFISMELVMTKDNHLVVFRDIVITNRTNVADIFPGRARQDGKYYIIDFTLLELQQLSLVDKRGDYPAGIRIPAFSDVLFLLRRLEKNLGYSIGIAPEIKKPWFHLNEGKDISSRTVDILEQYGYTETGSVVLLQCYDPEELQKIHKTLLPSRAIDLQLVQLIDSNDGNETQRLKNGKWMPYNSKWMFTRLGTKLLAIYADAVAVDKIRLLTIAEDPVFNDFLSTLKAAQVKILALFLNTNTGDTPAYFSSFAELLTKICEQESVDILVTDSPAQTIDFLQKRKEDKKSILPNQIQPLYTPTPLKE